MRADSGFYAHAVVAVCRKLGVRFSITIRQQPSMRRLIEAIPEAGWTPIEYWLAGGADVAETTRDLKYGVGLNHLPSGRFAANGAWLAVQVIAHNLTRWTARIGLAEGIVTTKTLRRRLFALAGRLAACLSRCSLSIESMSSPAWSMARYR